jgi:circadian clock protein KaiC
MGRMSMHEDEAAAGAQHSGPDLIAATGLAAQRTVLALGPRGSGKTVFALQSLISGIRRGEPGVLITFDQSLRELYEQAAFFGWDLADLQAKNSLRILSHAAPKLLPGGQVEMDAFLSQARGLAAQIQARRIVFDSFQVLLKMLKDRKQEVEETFRLREWLFENELAGVVTADVGNDLCATVPSYAFLQFMADCVVALNFRFSQEHFERTLRVIKYRGALNTGPEVLFRITKTGLELRVPPEAGPSAVPGASAIILDFERVRRELASRLTVLDGYLDVKQAEWDFLINKANPESLTGTDADSRPPADPRWMG